MRRWIPWALYGVALAARLALLSARPYGDETHHYYVARGLGASPDNIVHGPDLAWLFWWRPVFSLLLSPGAQASFDDFRVNHILIAAGVAPLLFLWVRQRGGSQAAAAVAGAVAALHPYLVVWGVRAFPDGLMVTLYIAGLLLWERRQWAGAALILLAAAWTKEVALVGIAVLLAEELWRAGRSQRRWLPRPDRRHALLAGTLALSYVPHLYAQSLGAPEPGWTRGGAVAPILDGAFTTIWFLPFVVAALLVPQARRPALHALAYAAFYLAYHIVLGGQAEVWYFVQPVVLSLGAVVLLVDALASNAHASRLPRLERTWTRAPAAAAVLLLGLQVLVPSPVAAILYAGDGTHFSALETVEYELARDEDLWLVIEAMDSDDWIHVLLIDVEWFYAVWPFSERAELVHGTYTTRDDPARWWADRIEDEAHATIVQIHDEPRNAAIREVYGDCSVAAEGSYVLIRGWECRGRADALEAAWGGQEAGR